jgi:hypothetical protein
LGRIEKVIWNRQARLVGSVLKNFSPNTEPTEKDTKKLAALEKSFEQIAWNAGNSSAKIRWSKLAHSSPRKRRVHLKEVLEAFRETPFSGYPYPETHAFLIRRARPTEIQLELTLCPHRKSDPEIKPVADSLCKLHSQWMLGFASALAPGVSLEHIIQTPRCLQFWVYNSESRILSQ